MRLIFSSFWSSFWSLLFFLIFSLRAMAQAAVIDTISQGVAIMKTWACPLVTPGPGLHGRWGLSKYWAQEYVGADLARARLQAHGVQYASSSSGVEDRLAIWDGIATHGARVSNLIAGPSLSSLIPALTPLAHFNMVTFWTKFSFNAYVQNYESAFQLVQEKNNYAFYLNNSMEWNRNGRLMNVFLRLADRGVTTITSFGNGNQLMDLAKRQLAQHRKIIVVASLDPAGDYSAPVSSQSVPIIAAGAHHDLSSCGKSGEEELFGGSSGATPQVTAALLAFTLITGVHLPPEIALTLLENTAISYPHAGHPVVMLNSLKIVELGFLLQQRCHHSAQCILQSLTDPLWSSLAVDATRALQLAAQAFPRCFPAGNESGDHRHLTSASCFKQQVAFRALRTAALLQGSNRKLWELIACISNWNGLTINGAFYQRLAQEVQ